MTSRTLRIATCQFAVGSSIRRNAGRILRFMSQAKKARADIVHFSECALSGYAGFDHEDLSEMDWDLLQEQTERILAAAKKCKLWVILGSTHPLTPPHKPHNCLYLINPQGNIADRYDKRFCTPGDLKHYSPGDHFVTFTICGVKCALLICFDLRFPPVYQQLKQRKVDCIFQSFYNARQKGPSIHTHIMRQTMQGHAASWHFWVSLTNSSAWYSPYPSCFILPDGRIARQLPFHTSGMMVNTVDRRKTFYDPMAAFRPAVLRGALGNGPAIRDVRSKNRTCL